MQTYNLFPVVHYSENLLCIIQVFCCAKIKHSVAGNID